MARRGGSPAGVRPRVGSGTETLIFEASVDGRRVRVEVRPRAGGYDVSLDGRPVAVDVVELPGSFTSLLLDGRCHDLAVERVPDGFRVGFPGGSVPVELVEAERGPRPAPRPAGGPVLLTAPMPGRVLRVLAPAGTEVTSGQGLVVVEAMKMENELKAPRSGLVERVAVAEGQAVEAGALLLVIA
jgi:acetyl/propionyl-CoA carboxylase alpha subunit